MEFLFQLDSNFCQKEITNRFNKEQFVSDEFIQILTELHQHTDSYDVSLFDDFELKEVFTYLSASHTYYLKTWLPKINQTIFNLKSGYANTFMAVQLMTLFLEKYQLDLERHIAYEEQVLFAFVKEMLNGNYSAEKKDFVINHFLFTHNDNVIVHLKELKEDLVKFEEGLKENLIFQVLFSQLEIFQNDLLIHGLIEDEIFIPKILDYIDAHFEKIERLSHS
jgi:regulator of cell morphogenesis and NO signaling